MGFRSKKRNNFKNRRQSRQRRHSKQRNNLLIEQEGGLNWTKYTDKSAPVKAVVERNSEGKGRPGIKELCRKLGLTVPEGSQSASLDKLGDLISANRAQFGDNTVTYFLGSGAKAEELVDFLIAFRPPAPAPQPPAPKQPSDAQKPPAPPPKQPSDAQKPPAPPPKQPSDAPKPPAPPPKQPSDASKPPAPKQPSGCTQDRIQQAYSVLQLGPNATKDEVEKQYRRLSMMSMPNSADATERARQLKNAYDYLMACWRK
jgi:hypothetical protein